MPNQRDRSKKLVGFFATDEEKRLIQKAAKAHKMTVAGFIRAIATGELKVSPHIKTIALSMMGAQQTGCGGTLVAIAILAGLALCFF